MYAIYVQNTHRSDLEEEGERYKADVWIAVLEELAENPGGLDQMGRGYVERQHRADALV